MIIFSIIIGLIILHYSYLLSSLANKISAISLTSALQEEKQNGISIIIPFRNEGLHLEDSIKSLLKLSYSTECFEIIFINDHSSDNFIKLFAKYKGHANIRLIENDAIGKKSAVESGIKRASFDWILMTDADCLFDEKWLLSANYLINNSVSDLYVFAVYTPYEKGLLSKFQYYDSLSTLGFNLGYFSKTGKVLLASAANLLYRKKDFIELDPYSDNKEIQSGDDIFLLNKFKEAQLRIEVNFKKGTWVKTKANSSWMELIDQRVRWVKKMRTIKKDEAFNFGLYIFIIQLALLLSLASIFCNVSLALLFAVFLIAKAYNDYRLMRKLSLFEDINVKFGEIFFLEFIYMLFVPLLLIVSIFRKPLWKGRKITS